MRILVIALLAGLVFTPSLLASEEEGKVKFILDWVKAGSLNPYTITPVGVNQEGHRIFEVACEARHILCAPQRTILDENLLEVGRVNAKGEPEFTASYGEPRLFPLIEGKEYTEPGYFGEWGEVTHHFLVGDTEPDGTIPVLIETTSLETGEVVRSEIRYFDPQRPVYWTKIEVLVLLARSPVNSRGRR